MTWCTVLPFAGYKQGPPHNNVFSKGHWRLFFQRSLEKEEEDERKGRISRKEEARSEKTYELDVDQRAQKQRSNALHFKKENNTIIYILIVKTDRI